MPFPGNAWHVLPLSYKCFVLLQTLLTVTWQNVSYNLLLWLFTWLLLTVRWHTKINIEFSCVSADLGLVHSDMRELAGGQLLQTGLGWGHSSLLHVSHPSPGSSGPAQVHPSLGHDRSTRTQAQPHRWFSGFCLHHDIMTNCSSEQVIWSNPDSRGWRMYSLSCWEDLHSYMVEACPCKMNYWCH